MINSGSNAYRGTTFELLRRLPGSGARFGCGDTTGVISRLILQDGLSIVFQPLVDQKNAHVYAPGTAVQAQGRSRCSFCGRGQ